MRRAAVCILIVVSGALSGCGGGGSHVGPTPGDMPESMKAGSAAVGAKGLIEGFRPVTVRVHPLSRMEMEGASRHLVLHLELMDAWGHMCKWPGVVRVEVSGVKIEAAGEKTESLKPTAEMNSRETQPADAPPLSLAEPRDVSPAGSGGDARGSVWWMDLREAEVNAKAFDGITQTYVLRVPVVGEWGVAGVGVKVSWTEADGNGASVTLEAAGVTVK